MPSPRENTAAVEGLRAQVLAHPMCARLREVGGAFVVTYPAGAHPAVDGARSSYSDGKARALERLLPVLERHWREGTPS